MLSLETLPVKQLTVHGELTKITVTSGDHVLNLSGWNPYHSSISRIEYSGTRHQHSMRFCIVTTQEHRGGGEILIASIADELGAAGHDVAWIARSNSQVAKDLEMSKRNVLYLVKSRGRSLRDLRAVRAALLGQWKPDAVIMNDTHAVVLAGLATLGAGASCPVRLAYKHTIFPLRSKLKYRFLADKVVCVSNAARQTIVDGGLPGEDAVVVYGGATPPIVDPDARASVRNELGIDDSVALLVCVGNLLACKGHADLIAAIEILGEGQRVVLAIAGEGAERAALEEQIRTKGLAERVRLLGFRKDANRLLQAADLVVHPSHSEGLSLVLIQAQMLEKPIVATAVGGAKEVLDVEPSCRSVSWIAEPENSVDLAQKITLALQSVASLPTSEQLQQQLSAVATRARNLFGLEGNSRQLAQLATELQAR